MAGAQFEYDESSGTFFYFLISFYALLLFPATYYGLFGWGKKKKAEEGAKASSDRDQCRCAGCEEKRARKAELSVWGRAKPWLTYGSLILAWIGFAALAWKVSHIEMETVQFDPYAILGLDSGATDRQIKKAYRTLSLKLHPDRGGDPKQFVALTKAYQALTDEEAKKNWDQYGNPDGPGATTFGIALPKWLVSKEYGIWVLAAYGLVFMILLPTGVGIWWYNSIKYSADSVLMDTMQLYGYMFHKTPNMILRRIIMILGASFEFSKAYNKEVVERPSDQREVPMLIKELSNLGEKNKERPLCFPYSLKARAILHAHLSRIPLPTDTLESDRRLILAKTPALIQEMISILSQLVGLAAAGRVARMPSIETMENVMRLSPMLVQGLWEKQSPLLQLPHFSEDMLRYCVTKRRRVKTCADLASLSETERRSLFRRISDEEYADIRAVLARMPQIKLSHRVEVQGEDDKHTITAGSLVTVHVHLTRTSLQDMMEASGTEQDELAADEEEEENNKDQLPSATAQEDQEVLKRKPWERPQKKAKNKKKPANKAKAKPQPPPPPPKETTPKEEESKSKESKAKSKAPRDEDEEEGSDWEDSQSGNSSEEEDIREALAEANRPETEDEDDLVFDDELIKKERLLETKSKITHPVHCPHFPGDKYEWWWVMLTEKKSRLLVASPVAMTTLVSEDEVELKFQAPPKPGTYTFTLSLRSDSYLDADLNQELKMDVEEARHVTDHPQWDFPSEDEDKDKSSASDHSLDGSEYTEGEEEDDD